MVEILFEVMNISSKQPKGVNLLPFTCFEFVMMYNFSFDLQVDSSRNQIYFLTGQGYQQVHDIQGLSCVAMEMVKKKVVGRM